eukprot:gene23174-29368_t
MSASDPLTVPLMNPTSLWRRADGMMLVVDAGSKRVFKAESNSVFAIAGGNKDFNTVSGNGDGYAATSVRFVGEPFGLAVDTTGVIFVSDRVANTIRSISGAIIHTFAGFNHDTYNININDQGPASSASLSRPSLIHCDSSYLFVADTDHHRVRRINLDSSHIDTCAGSGVAVSSAGSVFDASESDVAATSAVVQSPRGVWSSGRFTYVVQTDSCVIRVVDSFRMIRLFGGVSGTCLHSDADNAVATSTSFLRPHGVVGDSKGNLYISSMGAGAVSNHVYMISSDGRVRSLAGGGSNRYNSHLEGSAVLLGAVASVFVDTIGDIYATDGQSHIVRRLTKTDNIARKLTNIAMMASTDSPTADPSNEPSMAPVELNDDIYLLYQEVPPVHPPEFATYEGHSIVAGVEGLSYGFGADDTAASSTALKTPYAVWGDTAGQTFIADQGSGRVLMVSVKGLLSGVTNGSNSAINESAFVAPTGLWGDSMGNLYVSDSSAHDIRRIDSNGTSTRVVGQYNMPSAEPPDSTGSFAIMDEGGKLHTPMLLSGDTAGNVYVADRDNHMVRMWSVADGTIVTIAGSGANSSTFADDDLAISVPLVSPTGVYVDTAHDIVYITQPAACQVVQVYWNKIRSRRIAVFAGSGACGYLASQDGGQATLASLLSPQGVFGDTSGNIYISDFPLSLSRSESERGTRVHIVSYDTLNIFTIAVNPSNGSISSLFVDSAGAIYAVDVNSTVVRMFYSTDIDINPPSFDMSIIAGVEGIRTIWSEVATLSPPYIATETSVGALYGVWRSADGTTYFTDTDNPQLFKVAPSGVLSVVTNGTLSVDVGQTTTSAYFRVLCGIWGDSNGLLYFADQGRGVVRRIDTQSDSGNITHFAGRYDVVSSIDSTQLNGDHGLAVNATLYRPEGICGDSNGQIFVADSWNYRVRVVSTTGIITAVAGSGAQTGARGDGSAATSAVVKVPTGVWVDSAGGLYITQPEHGFVRKVALSTGIIVTFAGYELASRASGMTGPATSAKLPGPQGVGGDSLGNIYIGDALSSGVPCYLRMISVENGKIYQVTESKNLGRMLGLFVDSTGDRLYVTDNDNCVVRELTSTLTPTSAPTQVPLSIPGFNITLYAGGHIDDSTDVFTTSGDATDTLLGVPAGIFYNDDTGYLTFADSTSQALLQVANDEVGNLVWLDGRGPSSPPPVEAAFATGLWMFAIATGNNYYFADFNKHILYYYTDDAAGTITTFAGNYDQASVTSTASNGDGLTATDTSVTLRSPMLISGDSAGNVYFCDYGNNKIRMVSADANIISTVMGTGQSNSFNSGGDGPATSAAIESPVGIHCDTAGVIYVGDYSSYTVRAIDIASGMVRVIAGTGGTYSSEAGPATSGTFGIIEGLWMDTLGRLFAGDSTNKVIRTVYTRNAQMYTVAGGGSVASPDSSESFSATTAVLNTMFDLTGDTQGNMYVTDTIQHRIRKLTVVDIVSLEPTGQPSVSPSIAPSAYPTWVPSTPPTTTPSLEPSKAPSTQPSIEPSVLPTIPVTESPSATPSLPPSVSPTISYSPIAIPSVEPTEQPTTEEPTEAPTAFPSLRNPLGPMYLHTFTGESDPINGGSFGGDGGSASTAHFWNPSYCHLTDDGVAYITDSANVRLRRVGTDGIITTFAGGGDSGNADVAVRATSFYFYSPVGLWIDAVGSNVYVGDYSAIFKISVVSGIVSRYAGQYIEYTESNEALVGSGDGAAATSATIYCLGMTGDTANNMYVADFKWGEIHRVRRIDGTSGIITTIAGTGVTTADQALGDGGPATSAAVLQPNGMWMTSDGDLYISCFSFRIRRVTFGSANIISTYVGGGDVATGEGVAATSAALYNLAGLCLDTAGNLYLGRSINGAYSEIRMVSASNQLIYTVAGGKDYSVCSGDGCLGTDVVVLYTNGLFADSTGEIYFPDSYANIVFRLTDANPNPSRAPIISPSVSPTLHSPSAAPTASTSPTSSVTVPYFHSTQIAGVYGPYPENMRGAVDGLLPLLTNFNVPVSIWSSTDGVVYITDKSNYRVRGFTASSGAVMQTFIGSDAAQNGDEGPATGASIGNGLSAVWGDSVGNIYITEVFAVRRVTNGIITRGGAASSAVVYSPFGVWAMTTGDVFISESANSNRVRKIKATSRVILTIAGFGGLRFGGVGDGFAATSTLLTNVKGICGDTAGNIYVAGTRSSPSVTYNVRAMSAQTGLVQTVAGDGSNTCKSPSGCSATTVKLGQIGGLFIDANCSIFITDLDNNVMRKITVSVFPFEPSTAPTAAPSLAPSIMPSFAPSVTPTYSLLSMTSATPSVSPSAPPSWQHPSLPPSAVPSVSPTVSDHPSVAPSHSPSISPTLSVAPSMPPSVDPSVVPSLQPVSGVPPVAPSANPSCQPTTATPSTSLSPSAQPSIIPSNAPAALLGIDRLDLVFDADAGNRRFHGDQHPAAIVARHETQGLECDTVCVSELAETDAVPTVVPTFRPSVGPTLSPTGEPIVFKASTRLPTSARPTLKPSVSPSVSPSTGWPSSRPSSSPSFAAPPEIESIRAERDKLSPKYVLQVTVILNGGDGIVFCGVFVAKPTRVYDIQKQRFSAVTNQSQAALSVSGLAASTHYNVYCMVQSLKGVRSSDSVALSLFATYSTACCKTASIRALVPTMYQSTGYLNALQISLDSPPTIFLTVTLSVTPSDASVSFHPRVMQFTNTSTSLVVLVSFVAGGVGTFAVRLNVSGDSRQQYVSNTAHVKVIASGQEPSPPMLQSASFNGDGAIIVLSFDSPTNRGGYTNGFPCGALLTFDGSAQALCQWTDGSTIAVYPAFSSPLTVNSTIALNSGSGVKALCTLSTSACALWQSAPAKTVRIIAPAVATLPKVVSAAQTPSIVVIGQQERVTVGMGILLSAVASTTD